MRRFVRFQRTFFVGVYTEYFRVLESRQVLRNELVNYENLTRALERAEAMAEAGRLPEFQVDQTRQDVLSARDRLERAQQRYHESLDDFKLTLALPTEAHIVLDLAELKALEETEPTPLPYSRDYARQVALRQRLDLRTAEGQVVDANRKVEVAINQLRPGLDVVLRADTATEDTKPLKFAGYKNAYSAALELDLPLERTSERNAFRRRLIQAQAALRGHEELRDTVVQQVRNRWRAYLRARRSYEIQSRSVELARSRVESTSMLLEAGRANTRDMLEAREALLGARNALVQAVVDYKVARLELARDMDILTVHPDGQMEANFSEYAPQ
jgi:outer membrane protein TolC